MGDAVVPLVPQTEFCGNCKFAFPIVNPIVGAPTLECRYNPPSIFGGMQNNGAALAYFPTVKENWWCNFWIKA